MGGDMGNARFWEFAGPADPIRFSVSPLDRLSPNETASLSHIEPVRSASEEAADDIPGSTRTTVTIAIGGEQSGVINTPDDEDWFAVELVAGESYVFTLVGAGDNALPDPYLDFYGYALEGWMTWLAIDDDGGPGKSSLLRYTANFTGTHYIIARSWQPEGGVDETGIGGYTLTANIGPPQNPLDTIDLGYTVPTLAISVYFARAGEVHNGETAVRDWTETEIVAAFSAMATFEAVTSLTFNRASSASEATFIFTLADLDPGVLGQFPTVGGVGYGAFAPDGYGWSAEGLSPGGEGFSTIIHEVGHGLGLAHPHDNGGVDPDNSSEIMQGVRFPFGWLGTFGLNVGLATIMTYNSAQRYEGGDPAWGSMSTPGTLDIALLQSRYGVNESTNAGDTVYVVNDLRSAGAYFAAIWDVGGVDSIIAGGSPASVIIDLRAATLLNASGGGGWVSTSNNGSGYVIANGVVIENATGGTSGDSLVGNAVANVLDGGQGDDTLVGGAGTDTLIGGAGADGAAYADDPAGVVVDLGGGWAVDGWGDLDTLTGVENVEGSAHNDVLISSSSAGRSVWLAGGDGDDWIVSLFGSTVEAGSGHDTIIGSSISDIVSGGDGSDVIVLGDGDDYATAGSPGHSSAFTDSDWVDAGAGNDWVDGGWGDDVLFGQDGHDRLEGGSGYDVLVGAAGDDWLGDSWGSGWIDGGDGDDTVSAGGGGSTTVLGGAGTDTLIIAGSGWFDLAAGVYASTEQGSYEPIWIAFSSIENFTGRGTIFGDHNNNVLTGSEYEDILIGRGGNDTLYGGSGPDWLDGGDGDDYLAGSSGFDINDTDFYTGGAGADTIFLGRMCGWDVVFDFNPAGGDRFDLADKLWSGFVEGDFDGDGAADDTLLGYEGGNLVALNITGLTLDEWNALVTGG